MRLLNTVVAILFLAPGASAQLGSTRQGDARVRKTLTEAGIEFTVDDDGDFKLIRTLDNGRTQLVYINSGTETFKNLEIREVWAPAHKTTGQFPAKVANDLLLDSFRKKIGAWQTIFKESDNSYLAVFAAKIDADADAPSLNACITAVAQSADEMEEKLTGDKDEF
uniref:YbjN domain-containing protein n=1 Tax=candidate division WOR-3 bacterium TaxID=2052148 RepID=A0A7C4CC45_UNCW3